jgi:hypothetical protein
MCSNSKLHEAVISLTENIESHQAQLQEQTGQMLMMTETLTLVQKTLNRILDHDETNRLRRRIDEDAFLTSQLNSEIMMKDMTLRLSKIEQRVDAIVCSYGVKCDHGE